MVPSPSACRAHPYFSANSFLPASCCAHTVFQHEKTWGWWLPIPLPAPLLPYLPALAACTVPDRVVASMLAQNMAGHCLGRHKTMPETRLTLSCYRGPGPARGGEAPLCLGFTAWKDAASPQDLLGDVLRTRGDLARGCCTPIVPVLLGRVQRQTEPVIPVHRRASRACTRREPLPNLPCRQGSWPQGSGQMTSSSRGSLRDFGSSPSQVFS